MFKHTFNNTILRSYDIRGIYEKTLTEKDAFMFGFFFGITVREKYPEKCPWDLGPNQHLAKEENWTLRLGEANVCFSKNKLDNNYFHVISNENEEQILAFRARLLYQKLLDKGFRLVE